MKTFNSKFLEGESIDMVLSNSNQEADPFDLTLVINSSNVVGKRELGTGTITIDETTINLDNGGYVTSNTMGSGFTVSATRYTILTKTTITIKGDDLFFSIKMVLVFNGVTTEDGEVTISSTVTNTNTMGSGFVLEDGDGTDG